MECFNLNRNFDSYSFFIMHFHFFNEIKIMNFWIKNLHSKNFAFGLDIFRLDYIFRILNIYIYLEYSIYIQYSILVNYIYIIYIKKYSLNRANSDYPNDCICYKKKLLEFPVKIDCANEKAFNAAQYPFFFQKVFRMIFFDIEVRFFGTAI